MNKYKSTRIWLAGLALLLLPQHAARQDHPRPWPPRLVAQRAEPPPAQPPAPGTGAPPEPAPEAVAPPQAERPPQPEPPPEIPVRRADFGSELPSPDARHLADWAVDSGDHLGRPFAIVDKTDARVYVFDADGRLQRSAPALLGLAPGDGSVPGIGERPIAAIRPHERTTPAGRYIAQPGLNSHGEDIVWVDYEVAISMHRIRPVDPRERRLERLASPTPEDNRISYGCINLPPEFYDGWVAPLIGANRGVIYVLPEVLPVQQVFGSYEVGEPASRQEAAATIDPDDESFWRAVMAR